MEIETIKEDAKGTIIKILNKSLLVEYDLILNYPRMIDKLVNYDKINDEQLNADLERLGKDSLRHFGEVVNLIKQLGGEPTWQLGAIERLDDVEKLLLKQLDKEKAVISLYKEARQVAKQNTIKVQVRDFFGRQIRMKDELPVDIVNASNVINTLDRHAAEEVIHVRLAEDSIATLNMYMNK